MPGTVTNTSVSLATNIIIWAPAMSGCSVNRSGWIVSMDGNEAMPIGGITPSATTVTGRIAMAMSSQGMTTGIDVARKTKSSSVAGAKSLQRANLILQICV
jgi:hypothetical protein